ncbi:hypothetical protein BdWA1_000412 [Babesia duncani]|uniref:Secreted ookinete protein n=1 Tax=Babesia duncani TaxID=323732 RepID=A0AAD9UM60_9APIC|nr:hypothetical protein BdWA1_004210 [Babesia duncani]KAK2197412.1 hypothetical protein BdWA1_000412 [Babesia duncani]
MNLFTAFLMLFSVHYKSAFLHVNENKFELQGIKYVIPKVFIPSFIDLYVYKGKQEIPFMVNLIFKNCNLKKVFEKFKKTGLYTPHAFKWFHNYFFINKNNKLVNLALSRVPYLSLEHTLDSSGKCVTYYTSIEYPENILIAQGALKDHLDILKRTIYKNVSPNFDISNGRFPLKVTVKLKSALGKIFKYSGELIHYENELDDIDNDALQHSLVNLYRYKLDLAPLIPHENASRDVYIDAYASKDAHGNPFLLNLIVEGLESFKPSGAHGSPDSSRRFSMSKSSKQLVYRNYFFYLNNEQEFTTCTLATLPDFSEQKTKKSTTYYISSYSPKFIIIPKSEIFVGGYPPYESNINTTLDPEDRPINSITLLLKTSLGKTILYSGSSDTYVFTKKGTILM